MNAFSQMQSNHNMNQPMKPISCVLLAVAATQLFAATPSPSPAPAATAAPKTMTSTNAKTGDLMTQLFGDPVIAKGKGFEIKRSQLDEVVDGLKASVAARGQSIPPEQLGFYEGKFLDRLIQIQLLLQKASDADKAEGKKKAEAQIADLVQRAGSQEKFDQQLKLANITSTELRAKMADEVTALVTLQRESGAVATDAEVKSYYTDHPADFEQPERVRVRHVLLLTVDPDTRVPVADDKKKAKQKQMADLLKRARGGEDFAKLAEQFSEDPGSKTQGGELPPFEKDGTIAGGMGSMLPAFTSAAFALTNKQVSDIVETEYGYHIIQSLGKIPASKLALADKIPQGSETVGEWLKDHLSQQKLETRAQPYLETLEKDGKVEILDPGLKASIASLKAMSASNAPPASVTPAK